MAKTQTIWRVLLPPAFRESLGDAATRRGFRFKRATTITAILLDVAIFVLLRNSAVINHHALRVFALFNIGLLVVEFGIGELTIRFARKASTWRLSLSFSAVVLALTSAVWIQLTGSLTSYFIIGSMALVTFFRLTFDYTIGLVTAASMYIFHGGLLFWSKPGCFVPNHCSWPRRPGSTSRYRWKS